MPRCKADPEAEAGYYHCISRIVQRQFLFGEDEKAHFYELMRGYEKFCGVNIITYCLMENHFHILLEVPQRPPPEDLPNDKELVDLVREAGYSYDAPTLKQDLERFRSAGQDDAAEKVREKLFSRMWDVSWFMKMLKQRFSQWYNGRNDREGTLWGNDRFRSVLVEGEGPALMAVAAYIDLNPVRAGIVKDPAEFEWSGFGEASAGNGGAKCGLRIAAQALVGEEIDLERTMDVYRCSLYLTGIERKADISADGATPARRGFSREEAEEVLSRGGKLPLKQAIRRRVRAFSEAQVFGSRDFVDGFFNSHRARFGKSRTSGARALRGIEGVDLFSLRDLRERKEDGAGRGEWVPPVRKLRRRASSTAPPH